MTPYRHAAGLGVVFVLLAELVLALFIAACFAVGVAGCAAADPEPACPPIHCEFPEGEP